MHQFTWKLKASTDCSHNRSILSNIGSIRGEVLYVGFMYLHWSVICDIIKKGVYPSRPFNIVSAYINDEYHRKRGVTFSPHNLGVVTYFSPQTFSFINRFSFATLRYCVESTAKNMTHVNKHRNGSLHLI